MNFIIALFIPCKELIYILYKTFYVLVNKKKINFFRFVLPPTILVLLSADDLCERVTGPKTFDMELFKRNTVYQVKYFFLKLFIPLLFIISTLVILHIYNFRDIKKMIESFNFFGGSLKAAAYKKKLTI